MTGTPISAVSVTGTPVTESWIITFGASGDTLVMYATGGTMTNYTTATVLIGEGDTTTALITGVQVILADSVAVTNTARIDVFTIVPLKAENDSTLSVTAHIATLADSININFVAVDSQAATLLVDYNWRINTGYDDSMWVMVDDSVLVWQSHDLDVAVKDSAKVWHDGDLRVSLQDSGLVYVSNPLEVAVPGSVKVYHDPDLRVSVQDSALVYVSNDLIVAVQDSAKVYHTEDLRVSLQDSGLVYVSHPLQVTVNDTVSVSLVDNVATIGTVGDSAQGAGLFTYMFTLHESTNPAMGGDTTLVVRYPSSGNTISIRYATFQVDPVATYDEFLISFGNGAAGADSLAPQYIGKADDYNRSVWQVWDPPWATSISADSALSVIARITASSTADSLRVNLLLEER